MWELAPEALRAQGGEAGLRPGPGEGEERLGIGGLVLLPAQHPQGEAQKVYRRSIRTSRQPACLAGSGLNPSASREVAEGVRCHPAARG